MKYYYYLLPTPLTTIITTIDVMHVLGQEIVSSLFWCLDMEWAGDSDLVDQITGGGVGLYCDGAEMWQAVTRRDRPLEGVLAAFTEREDSIKYAYSIRSVNFEASSLSLLLINTLEQGVLLSLAEGELAQRIGQAFPSASLQITESDLN